MPEETTEKEPQTASAVPEASLPPPEASAPPAASPEKPLPAPEKPQQPDKPDKPQQPDKPDKPAQPDKEDKEDKEDKPDAGGTGSADAVKSAAAPSAAELLSGEDDGKKVIRVKGSKNIHSGVANILATFNNTLVSITDLQGNVIAWSSAGRIGFRGSRKSTAFAAQQVSQDAARKAMGHGVRQVEVRVKGPGAGRESAIRALQAIGLEISAIKDVTPVPHNGCRPRKRRRV